MRVKELIPRPRSRFLRVKCPKCGNEQTAFDRSSTALNCNVCDELLLIPRGGKAEIKAEVVQELG
ncbi:MAG: 30S ribosomal protein S27e [Candidatus Bathyarchaeia archaeon]